MCTRVGVCVAVKGEFMLIHVGIEVCSVWKRRPSTCKAPFKWPNSLCAPISVDLHNTSTHTARACVLAHFFSFLCARISYSLSLCMSYDILGLHQPLVVKHFFLFIEPKRHTHFRKHKMTNPCRYAASHRRWFYKTVLIEREKEMETQIHYLWSLLSTREISLFHRNEIETKRLFNISWHLKVENFARKKRSRKKFSEPWRWIRTEIFKSYVDSTSMFDLYKYW